MLMSATPVSQPGLAGLPPANAGIVALAEQGPEPTSLPGLEPLILPSPVRPVMGRSPGAPPAAPLNAWRIPATAGSVLADSLGDRWELYRARLRSCQDDFSEETVHELRVATRKLMAQFVLLGCVTPGQTAENARRVLKRRLKALGDLRDAHVQHSFVERQAVRFPELMLVRDFLRRRERKLEKAAAAKVKRFKIRKLEKWTLALAQHLAGQSGPTGRPARLASRVARATAEAFADLVHRRQAIDPANAITIHRTRIAFKKFRYMVESLSPGLTGLSKRDLRTLAYYQRRMGILQDLEVIQQSINGFVETHEGMEGLLQPFLRYLHARRARALRSFLKSADKLFLFWPPSRAKTNGNFAAARHAA